MNSLFKLHIYWSTFRCRNDGKALVLWVIVYSSVGTHTTLCCLYHGNSAWSLGNKASHKSGRFDESTLCVYLGSDSPSGSAPDRIRMQGRASSSR